MNQTVTCGVMVPHPPIILPNIGQGEETKIQDIADAYRQAAREIIDSGPDTILIVSPHAPCYFDYIQISDGPAGHGSMAQFRDPADSFRIPYDQELIRKTASLCEQAGIPAGTLGKQDGSLDHGTMVPLYFLQEAVKAAPEGTRQPAFVRIGTGSLNSRMHYRVGQLFAQAAAELGRKIAVVGSGDLSHCQKEGSGYGFKPVGPAYDAMIMDIMGKGDFLSLLAIPEQTAEAAMVCGQKPFALMAGVMDGLKPHTENLGHSAEFGVGYGVVTYTNPVQDASRAFLEPAEEAARKQYEARIGKEDPYVKAARAVINQFVLEGTVPQLDPVADETAGVFVSVHKDGQLRGCIGTTEPVTKNVTTEIMQNAVSAVSRDPRFPAVQPWELEDLEISVDVLQPAQPVDSPDQLDVKKYGVIVSRGNRRGLLLPDLEGVDTVEKQLEIAKQKAGLSPHETGCHLERFEVVRHR